MGKRGPATIFRASCTEEEKANIVREGGIFHSRRQKTQNEKEKASFKTYRGGSAKRFFCYIRREIANEKQRF